LKRQALLDRPAWGGPAGVPPPAALFLLGRGQDVVADAVLGAAVEHGHRLVHDQELRALDHGARNTELLALGRGQAPARHADIEVQADLDHRITLAELGHAFRDQGADPLLRLGLAVCRAAAYEVD